MISLEFKPLSALQGSGLSPRYFKVVQGDEKGRSLRRDHENRGLVSHRVWHDKDPSLLKIHVAKAEIGSVFHMHEIFWSDS